MTPLVTFFYGILTSLVDALKKNLAPIIIIIIIIIISNYYKQLLSIQTISNSC